MRRDEDVGKGMEMEVVKRLVERVLERKRGIVIYLFSSTNLSLCNIDSEALVEAWIPITGP